MDSSKTRKASKHIGDVDAFVVQCAKCSKWRLIPTQEEYEDIRSKLVEEPFYCNSIPDVSCEDAADMEYDSSRIWAIDKPGIPKTPADFKRELRLRKDCSKMDAYYITPDGKKARSLTDIATFLQQNPDYNGLSLSDFSFTTPKIKDDTIPEGTDDRRGSVSANKRIKTHG